MPVAIETARLLLREYQPGDHAALHTLLSDPVTMQFWPAPFTPAQTEAWIERQLASYAAHGFGRWAVCKRETGVHIGDVGLMRTQVNGRDEIDLGYIIHAPFWRQGYALEAARAALTFARAHPAIARVVANMPHNHHGSRRVAEALGMGYAGDFINARNRHTRTLLYVIEV
ncbi:MAG: GNAT family N-acetyltransferase [Chloroflexi bacterium SZAS-1]|jgi:RimJ/RimL family protein N-acetyltransferase|nr:GNAT family N-acetyltransferase [Chloroflexi bacterium SZAS-1]